jgi:hypothetical protein
MADKEAPITAVINEMYGVVSELLISSDKAVQERASQLRKLIEQMERQIAQQ